MLQRHTKKQCYDKILMTIIQFGFSSKREKPTSLSSMLFAEKFCEQQPETFSSRRANIIKTN